MYDDDDGNEHWRRGGRHVMAEASGRTTAIRSPACNLATHVKERSGDIDSDFAFGRLFESCYNSVNDEKQVLNLESR